MTVQPVVTAHGAAIPALGLGTWAMRGGECTRAVEMALACGYRHIDTASMYGNEEAVGEGIRRSGVPREEIFVVTKVWHDQLRDGALQRSAAASLKRLGLDVIDLLLIHWPDPSVPLDECVPALADARRRGYARHIGVSNFSPAMLETAIGLSDAPIVCNQCEYHPYLDQAALISTCRRLGVAFVSYCPLGRMKVFTDPVIAAIAKAHEATAAQVVLAWHIAQGLVAIPKSSNRDRIVENFGALSCRLTPDEVARITVLTTRSRRLVSLD